MAELGITLGEVLAGLPSIVGEFMEAYNPDHKISPTEGVNIAASVLDMLAGACDDPDYADLFTQQAEALRSLGVVLGE